MVRVFPFLLVFVLGSGLARAETDTHHLDSPLDLELLDTRAVVSVVDGDTLVLDDGREV